MSKLRPDDDKFHYSDGSHKWIPPNHDCDQEQWNEQVRQHQQRHLAGEHLRVRMGRRLTPGRPREVCRSWGTTLGLDDRKWGGRTWVYSMRRALRQRLLSGAR
jgi:hypothetical protein